MPFVIFIYILSINFKYVLLIINLIGKLLIKYIDEQQDTIEELQQKYDKLCIEMANIYSKYIFMKEFSEDTNPNEAVKYVLRELMQKTKEVR